jgi:hypothetical protein
VRVYLTEESMTVGEAPVGLLLLESGELIMKTEYATNENVCECYIVSSGERYHGEGNRALCRAMTVY